MGKEPVATHGPEAGEARARYSLDSTQLFGDPLRSACPELESLTRELQAELVGLATDVRRGPLTRHHSEAGAYLGELRREFLRHHRRLVVQTRTDDRVQLLELIRSELAELSERLRTVVLSRSSRMSQELWRPSLLVTALERTMEVLPEWVPAEYEPRSLARQPGDTLLRRMARWLLRGKVRIKRLFGGGPRRMVPMRSLARYHLIGMTMERVEGLAALFVQADQQLVSHSRLILDGIARGFDIIREHAVQEDLQDVLASFRQQVEEEFALAEEEMTRLVDDGARRAARILGEGMKAVKADLPVLGTFELPARRRRAERMVAAQGPALEDLERRMAKVRETIAASYVYLGLHLETASFRARVRVMLGRQLSELRKDVRGRSHTQIERVLHAVEETLEGIAGLAAEGSGSNPPAASAPSAPSLPVRPAAEEEEEEDTDDLPSWMESLERVLSEAMRAANQLVEQLTEEQLVAPLLDGLNREAQALTDRYKVPAGRLPHAEWRLPAPLPTVEVFLSDVAAAYVQTDIAPELLRITNAAVTVLQPMLTVLHDLERVVTIDSEHYGGELDLERPPEGESDLSEVAVAALKRSRAALAEMLDRTSAWSDELTDDLRDTILSKIDTLRERLSEASVAQLRRRGGVKPQAFTHQVDRLTQFLNKLGDESTQWVRRAAGEERLASWRTWLGLPGVVLRPEDVAGLLVQPEPEGEIPLFYRRLFAANAHWAADLLPDQRRAVDRVKKVLARAPGVGLRTAAIISAEGAGQGALLAFITRGDRFNVVRRLTFSRPMSVRDVETIFQDGAQGQLLVVGGFHWLLSMQAGGFEPLRRFLGGVLADAGKNAWVLEAAEPVWAYARRLAPVEDVFSEAITVGPVSPQELEGSLMSRHALSGLGLRFAGPGEGPAAESGARERFFIGLHTHTGGRLTRALPAWLSSVVEVDEEAQVVRMGPPPPPVVSALSTLEDEILVLLMAVLRQGWVDGPTLAQLFRWDEVTAQGRLMRLVTDGLLERKTGGFFTVRRHLRHGLQEVLRSRGWYR
ncbi:MAG: hypothetical protein KC933_24140 [Myxococcales bacterium]|nr:hypothetical protein [Myxococcales bacterium]